MTEYDFLSDSLDSPMQFFQNFESLAAANSNGVARTELAVFNSIDDVRRAVQILQDTRSAQAEWDKIRLGLIDVREEAREAARKNGVDPPEKDLRYQEASAHVGRHIRSRYQYEQGFAEARKILEKEKNRLLRALERNPAKAQSQIEEHNAVLAANHDPVSRDYKITIPPQ